MDDLGDRGTTRGGGSPVKIIVKSDGVAVAGITVSAQAAGSAAVSKTTGADGVASFLLVAGHYTAQAGNGMGAASKSFNVVESTTAEIVALALAPISSQHAAGAAV